MRLIKAKNIPTPKFKYIELTNFYRDRINYFIDGIKKDNKEIYENSYKIFFRVMKKLDPSFCIFKNDVAKEPNRLVSYFLGCQVQINKDLSTFHIKIKTNVHLHHDISKQGFWLGTSAINPNWIKTKIGDTKNIHIECSINILFLKEAEIFNKDPKVLILNEVCINIAKSLKLI